MGRIRKTVGWGICALALYGLLLWANAEPTERGAIVAEEVPSIPTETAVPNAPIEVVITAVGDVTLGGNMKYNPASTIYTREFKRQGGDYSFPFRNVLDIFQADDMTLVNFEGVLTDRAQPGNDNTFNFRIGPEHARTLTLGSVEAVALENNHVLDFGPQGYADTVAALAMQRIVYSNANEVGVYTTKQSVQIAMLSYQTFGNRYPELLVRVPQAIAAVRALYPLVIVSYHWGEELDGVPHERQVALGRATIDAGADLVLGHHSHRINPIEVYKGKYIVYSLGNFSFSGNARPRDMDTFIFQQKFTVLGGQAESGPFRIVPCRISTAEGINDFAPTPYTERSAAFRRVIDTLAKSGKNLTYAVPDYPTQWPTN